MSTEAMILRRAGQTIALDKSTTPSESSHGIAVVLNDHKGVFPPAGEDVSDDYIWLSRAEALAVAYALLALANDD